MKLSIIITVYNKEPFLRRSLDSLLKQYTVNEGDYEILAVNDGSSDGSEKILKEYSERYSCVRIISQINQGLSMARNNGVGEAKGDYVWFVDADDTFSNYAVSLINKAIDLQPDVIPIYAKFEGDDRTHNAIGVEAETGKDVLLDKWEHCGVFWIMRRRFLIENDLSFYPNIYHEDAEFTPRMLYAAKSVVVIPEVIYNVNLDPNSITQVPRPKRAFDCLLVAEHLCEFIDRNNERKTPIGEVFNYNAAVLINNGLDVIVKNVDEEQQKFNHAFRRKRRLVGALFNAPQLKYRIEALLFAVFPNHYVGIYKLMKYFG